MSERLDLVVGQVRLTCHLSGDAAAPPMVLLHALGETGASWDDVVPEFAEHYRVLTIDLRGHGDSDWPGTYSFELMREDVLGVLAALGMPRITLVGHSMGAAVAYLIAEEHPEQVERLVLEDAPPPYPRDRVLPSRPDGPLPFDWAVVPAIVEQVNVPDPAWWDRLTEVTAPALIIAGGPSSTIPQDKLEEAAARMPDCTVQTISVGHHVHAERPAEFAAAVLAFLRQ